MRILVPCALCIAAVGTAVAGLDNPVGLAALQQVEALPYLREGVSVGQFASFARTDANEDRNTWLYEDDRGEFVIMDHEGPGCVYRIWMTFGGGNTDYRGYATSTYVRVYLDEEELPCVDLTLAEFFGGVDPRFPKPLVGDTWDSGGGHYAYVPLPFRRRCRITLSNMPPAEQRPGPWADHFWVYYGITFHRLASADGVIRWTGNEDLAPVLRQWAHCGEDPKDTADNAYLTGTVALPPGHTQALARITGSGAIQSLEMDLSPHSRQVLADVRVRLTWDEQGAAAVDAPLGEFFGSGYGEVDVSSLLMGMRTNGYYYCFFPMPYWQSARVEVVNTGTAAVDQLSYRIGYTGTAYNPARAGYFHAATQRRAYTEGVQTGDYPILDCTGRGHYVGTVLSIEGVLTEGNTLRYLEGDERLYLDGNRTPQVHGTGNEDYFNGGWYYSRGRFSLPLHGHPARSSPHTSSHNANFTGAYRLHLGDVFPFNRSLRFGMEHGLANRTGGVFSSVAFYYLQPQAPAGPVPAAHIQVGDAESEAAAGYTVAGVSASVTNAWRYAGDDADTVTVAGRTHQGAVAFSVPVTPTNAGITIRRRMDAGVGRQRVRVQVDGREAGFWYTPDCSFSNVIRRWHDADFTVDRTYTAGKSRVDLVLQQAGEVEWNGYEYTVHVLPALEGTDDADGDGLPDGWEVRYFSDIGVALPDADDDEDGSDNRSEHIADTDPTDPGSRFRIVGLRRSGLQALVTVPASSDRNYDLQFQAPLGTADWAGLSTNTGAAGSLELGAPLPDGAGGFFRASVWP